MRDGYSAGEALVYGAVNGVLEGGLEYALGGISTLGKGGASKLLGKIPVLQKLKEMLPQAIKSPTMQKVLKTMGSYIARMGDEGFEEYLQAVIDPMVRNLILKEDNELDLLSDDALYAAFLGALTAGILNLPSAVTGGMSGGNAENQSLQNPLENGRIGIEGSGNIDEHLYNDGGIRTGDQGGGEKADDGGRTSERQRTYREDSESFQRRATEDVQGNSGRRLDQHGEGQIAYIPAQEVAPNSEAGKVASGLSGLGVQVIVTEGNFETNRNGVTTLHTDAVTASDGTVYVSNQTKIPAEQIVPHESLHVLQRQDSPAYDAFYDTILEHIDFDSETYNDVAGKINREHYGGKLDIHSPDAVKPIFTELSAYINQYVSADPDHARNSFSGMFRNWSAVVKASQALNTVIAGQNTSVQTASIKPLSAEAVVNTEKGQAQQTTVQGIAKVTDGEVEVKLREGKTVPLADVEFTNPTLGSLYEAAGNYVTGTAKAFVAGYDGSLPLTQYQAAFEFIHNQAVKGVAMDAAVEAAGDVGQQLSNSARKLAYNSGLRDAQVLHSLEDNGRIEAENVIELVPDKQLSADMGAEQVLDNFEKQGAQLQTNERISDFGYDIRGEIVKNSSAEEVNNWWRVEMGYDHPPYKLGTTVNEIKLSHDTMFVRVYDGDISGQFGGWLMKADDIRGLTPSQIQDKFALPAIPKFITDVKLPAGTIVRMGIVNPLDGWGNGGGVQFDLMGQRIGEFINPRRLQ